MKYCIFNRPTRRKREQLWMQSSSGSYLFFYFIYHSFVKIVFLLSRRMVRLLKIMVPGFFSIEVWVLLIPQWYLIHFSIYVELVYFPGCNDAGSTHILWCLDDSEWDINWEASDFICLLPMKSDCDTIASFAVQLLVET
jgi:hypothetical protein